jgi:hypothetical protein
MATATRLKGAAKRALDTEYLREAARNQAADDAPSLPGTIDIQY